MCSKSFLGNFFLRTLDISFGPNIFLDPEIFWSTIFWTKNFFFFLFFWTQHFFLIKFFPSQNFIHPNKIFQTLKFFSDQQFLSGNYFLLAKFFFKPGIFFWTKWTSMKEDLLNLRLSRQGQRFYFNWSLTLHTKSC